MRCLGFVFALMASAAAFASNRPSSEDRRTLLAAASLFLGEWSCEPLAGVWPFRVFIAWSGETGFELTWTSTAGGQATRYLLNSRRSLAPAADAVYKSHYGRVARSKELPDEFTI